METVINSGSLSQRGSAVEDRKISRAGDMLSEHKRGGEAGTQRHFEGHTLVQIHSNSILLRHQSSLCDVVVGGICRNVNEILENLEEDISEK